MDQPDYLALAIAQARDHSELTRMESDILREEKRQRDLDRGRDYCHRESQADRDLADFDSGETNAINRGF